MHLQISDVDIEAAEREMEDEEVYCHISRAQMHRYMRMYDMHWDVEKQSYYNDKSNSREVQLDNEQRFLPQQARLELRCFNWCTMKLANISFEAVNYLRTVLGITTNDPVPVVNRPEDDPMSVRTCKPVFGLDKRVVAVEGEDVTMEDKIKCHLDFLDEKTFSDFVTSSLSETGFPGEWFFQTTVKATSESNQVVDFIIPSYFDDKLACMFNHRDGACKCRRAILRVSQDETAFGSNLHPTRRWRVGDLSKLRKKGAGWTIMVSLILSLFLGAGYVLNPEQLRLINLHRATKGRGALEESPGLLLMEIGKNKEGYFSNEEYVEQMQGIVDCHNALFPSYQICDESDNSSNHNKTKPNGLDVGAMNKSWGGQQRTMRDTTVSAADLGSFTTPHCPLLRPGEVAKMNFPVGEGVPPPFYDRDAPRKDIEFNRVSEKEPWNMTEADAGKYRTQIKTHERRVVAADARNRQIDKENAKAQKKVDGRRGKSAVLQEKELIVRNTLIIEGFEGKPKGWKQALAERGHNTAGMINSKKPAELLKLRSSGKPIPARELCGDLVLGSHSDFVNELSIVEELLHCEGNIHIRTVICMPNTAGQGIEYCNGKAKYYFRHINERDTTHDFREKVVASFSSTVLPLLRLAKFRRRAYTYMEMYRYLYAGKPTDLPSFRELESRMAETKKTHRNIYEIEREYLRKSIKEDDA